MAEIWLWQVGSWKAVGRLHSHSLTVTQMEFSHDDEMLLAVSRDRQFSVFSVKTTGIISLQIHIYLLFSNFPLEKNTPFCEMFSENIKTKNICNPSPFLMDLIY